MDKVKLHLVQVAEASKQLPASQPPAITAALLETYSRLLIWLGTRNFQSKQEITTTCSALHVFLLFSPTDSCSVQEPGMACTACIAGGHCLSRSSTVTVFLPLSAPAAVAHCSGGCHHSHTALCLVGGLSALLTSPNTCTCSAENTTLRLIQGLSSPEFLLQLAKIYATDPKPVSEL